jgi:hypothetical protein
MDAAMIINPDPPAIRQVIRWHKDCIRRLGFKAEHQEEIERRHGCIDELTREIVRLGSDADIKTPESWRTSP